MPCSSSPFGLTADQVRFVIQLAGCNASLWFALPACIRCSGTLRLPDLEPNYLAAQFRNEAALSISIIAKLRPNTWN